ncbi:MAG: GTP pyrophosphokinase family protein [Lachnospiraceae bacterium]|nr:GTP pyrophosphokinase family protein [Lachnospiraceae bacterium]MCD7766976.1 GTP pyrophosphokinase family protein [Lachnospiraceae bacterium]
MEIQLWREILSPYDLAVKELVVKFEHLIYEYRNQGQYSPIEQVTGRVKTVASILDKVQKKHITTDELEERITDIAGVRIICQFVEDIQKVVEIIRARTDMEIVSERDYVSHKKDSGYRSYHIIVRYEVQTTKGSRKINVEIQIRTLAMNFWSTIEHSLQYKYKKNIPEHVSEKLSNVANAIITLDSEMSSVRSEIMDAQISSQMQAGLVSDILNNIQNLYRVTTKREVQKIQDEFYRIYELDDIDQLRRFARELDVIVEGYRAQTVEVTRTDLY